MRKVIAAVVTGLFLVGGAVAAQANLLKNGDFDEMNSSLSSLRDGQWGVYDSLPGGWYKGAGTAGIEVQYNTVVGAYSSNYSVELDSNGGVNTNSSMHQDVFLYAGQYDLSFMYYARTNGSKDDNGIMALLDTFEIGSISKKMNDMTADVWELVTWTFSIETDGFHQIGFAAFGNDNSYGGLIDSASLNASAPVPEPATMILFGAGLAGLASVSLRRKKK